MDPNVLWPQGELYYYVRAEPTNGQLCWRSPIWWSIVERRDLRAEVEPPVRSVSMNISHCYIRMEQQETSRLLGAEL